MNDSEDMEIDENASFSEYGDKKQQPAGLNDYEQESEEIEANLSQVDEISCD